LLLVFWGCGESEEEKKVEIPSYVLNEEQFTKLLTDYALAESAANLNVKNVALNKTDSVYAFNPLVENNVSKEQYDSTLSFYVHHPLLYKKVYENVLESLTKFQAAREAKKDQGSK
jgi:hypothetical protein